MHSQTHQLAFRVIVGIVASAFSICIAFAATTINAVNKYADGANIGCLDWRGDTHNGNV